MRSPTIAKRGKFVAPRRARRQDNLSEDGVAHLPQIEGIDATVGVSNEVFATNVGITETDDVGESIERRERERGARDGVQEADGGGFVVEGD